MEKICTVCKTLKSETDFHKSSRNKSGLQPRCKPCQKEADKKYAAGKLRLAKERGVTISAEVEKTCTKCGETFPASNFYKQVTSKDRLGYNCKQCVDKVNKEWLAKKQTEIREYHTSYSRKAHLRRKFNIKIEQYDELYEKQKGLCGVCGKPESALGTRSNGAIQMLSVDHCHKTGKIRGLLCMRCNQGLGLLGDTLGCIAKALEYLKKV